MSLWRESTIPRVCAMLKLGRRTHSDTTVSLLKAGECLGTELEKILDETEWTKVRLTAHGDETEMPRRRSNWAAWNNTLVHLPEDHPEMAKVPKKAVRTEAPKADWVSW